MNICVAQASAWMLLSAVSAAAAEQPTGILAAYAANRDDGIGNYVTHDAILMGHQLCLEEAVVEAEASLYAPQVQTILKRLTVAAANAPPSPVTLANRQFITVLMSLSNGATPETDPVKQEVKKIRAAEGIASSAVLPETIDYSQFRVRGHYSRSPELSRYFQTVRYAGTVLFPVKESAATGIDAKQADLLTGQAMQLAGWIASDPIASAAYKRYTNQTGLLFGAPDDLVLSDLLSVASIKGVAEQRSALLRAAKKNSRQPQILAGLLDVGKLEEGVTPADALTGWRLFPQRRSPDGAAFQQLIFNNVGEYKGKQNPRSMDVINGQKVKAFPLALELPALLGSVTAVRALDSTDERNFQGYPAAFLRAQNILESSPPASWLPVMRQLLAVKTDTPEDSQQLVTTVLAYWTCNRHRSLLDEKQSYTPVAKGMPLTNPRNAAYLEPSTAVYAALLAQMRSISPALKPDTAKPIIAILEKCVAISRKESAGGALAAGDIAFLNDIDSKFLHIAGREDTPLVVDVHTNPSSQQVLEEAIGCPRLMEFKPPKSESKLRGVRLTHSEFRQPMSERMTDEEWLIRAQSSK